MRLLRIKLSLEKPLGRQEGQLGLQSILHATFFIHRASQLVSELCFGPFIRSCYRFLLFILMYASKHCSLADIVSFTSGRVLRAQQHPDSVDYCAHLAY